MSAAAFRKFNSGFRSLTNGVRSSVRALVHRIARVMVIYLVLCGTLVWGYMHLPSAFMPSEDQGVLLMMMQAPAGATAERTDKALDRFQKTVAQAEKTMLPQSFTCGASPLPVPVRITPWAF